MADLVAGARVALREFTADDATAVLAYHLDTEVMRFLAPDVRANQTLDAISGLLARTRADAARIPRVAFDLAATVGGEVVGAARLHLLAADPSAGEIGYILRRDAWGDGYGTEIARLLLAYGFVSLRLERIVATVDRSNLASMRVLDKAGMRVRGPLPAAREAAEGRNPSLVYQVTRSGPTGWVGPPA